MFYKYSFILLAPFLFTACGNNIERNIAIEKSAVVLAFGDSLTFGYGVSGSKSYPDQLAKITGLKVIRSGVNGELTAEGRDRLTGVLKLHKPDLLLLCLGGNDFLGRMNREKVKANLSAMISMSKDAGVDVVLIAVPEIGLWLEDSVIYEELADEHDIALVADIISDVLSKPSLKSDQTHPNVKGYALIAETIAKRLDIR